MSTFSSKLRRKQLDELLAGKDLPQLRRGYIREIRDALEMSSYQLADRMRLSQSSVKQLEDSERRGAITLKSLERVAEALGCKLVYGLIPKASLEQTVKQQALRKAAEITAGVVRTMALEQQSVQADHSNEMLADLADDILRKGGRELWQ